MVNRLTFDCAIRWKNYDTKKVALLAIITSYTLIGKFITKIIQSNTSIRICIINLVCIIYLDQRSNFKITFPSLPSSPRSNYSETAYHPSSFSD